MAQNLQLLKRRIKTSKNIAQISKAMEMISASKIKRAQTQASNNKPYTDRITSITTRIIGKTKDIKYTHPYIKTKTSDKTLLIALSPDRGLCGSLNANLFKKLIELEDNNTKLVTVGRKVGAYASRLNYDLVASYNMGTSLPEYSMVYQLKQHIDEELAKGRASKVLLLYADFVSLFTQIPLSKQLLPLHIESLDTEKVENEEDSAIFEPGIETLLDELLPYYMETQLYNALLQAYTSEQAARMIAMQNAKNNAFDIAEYLTLVYNKSRQERITNEILDLSNSRLI